MAVITSNRPPFSDVIDLVTPMKTADPDGYDDIEESARQIICTFSDAVARGEFYEGMKAGLNLSAEAEIWPEDYQHEELVEHNGIRYRVVRSYPTGQGTMILILTEVIR